MNTDNELNELFASLAGRYEAELDIEQGIARLHTEIRRISPADLLPQTLQAAHNAQTVDEPGEERLTTPDATDRLDLPLNQGRQMPHERMPAAKQRSSSAVTTAVATVDVALLVRHAAEGDRWAWERLVHQYAQLIEAITREFRLTESDAADVAQTTWLRLLENIDHLAHPDRVGSWLAATARNECLRALAARKRLVLMEDDGELKNTVAVEPEIDDRLLAEERAIAVRKALSQLPRRWQRLMELLMADPPASYAEISDQLGLPVASIGSTRGRCLARLRVLLQNS